MDLVRPIQRCLFQSARLLAGSLQAGHHATIISKTGALPCSSHPNLRLRPRTATTGSELHRILSRRYTTTKPCQGILQQSTASASRKNRPKGRPNDLLEEYKHHAAHALAKATGKSPSTCFTWLRASKYTDQGDLSIPMKAAPYFSEPENLASPPRWAEKWTESELIEKPVQSGDFLRISFKPHPLIGRVLRQALTERESFGFDPSLGLQADGQGQKRMVIDFSSPNIAKPFHAGHLRSTLCGAFIANLYEKQGWEVVRLNYLGDWGKQFGLLAVGFEKYGSEAKLLEDPIRHLYDVYVKINADAEAEEASLEATTSESSSSEVAESPDSVHSRGRAFFRRLEDGDPDALSLWHRFRELSVSKYQQTYERLNIHFDKYAGESAVDPAQIVEIVDKLKATGLVREDNGGLILDFPSRGGYTLLQKRDGTSLYITRDMAEALARYKEYRFDKMLYVVGDEQRQYFKNLFQALDVLGEKEVASKCVHVALGRVKGMSTRRGTAKFLDEILDEAAERMYEVMIQDPTKTRYIDEPLKVADTLGISAIAIQDMKSRRKMGYDFNLEDMTSFIGDTGPYLQYTHARLCSISRRAAIESTDPESVDFSVLQEASALLIARTILRWPYIVRETIGVNDAEPAAVVKYLFSLAHVVNGSYRELRVLGANNDVQQARMALYEAARQVLANGLNLLGLTPLTRM